MTERAATTTPRAKHMPSVMIIGPSKVGKSRLSVYAADLTGVAYISLDDAAGVVAEASGWFRTLA